MDRMDQTINSNELRRLEGEAHECERMGDALGALDIYEDIVRRGWAGARHLTALGYCYVKNRQRQNAKEIWLRALDLEPDNKLCGEALDKYFPGWQQNRPAPRLERQKEMPPPPPPAEFGKMQELTIVTVSNVEEQARKDREVRFSEPAAQPHPLPRAPQPQPAPGARFGQPGAGQRAAAAAASTPRFAAADGLEARVNWDLVMSDVAEEAASIKKR